MPLLVEFTDISLSIDRAKSYVILIASNPIQKTTLVDIQLFSLLWKGEGGVIPYGYTDWVFGAMSRDHRDGQICQRQAAT